MARETAGLTLWCRARKISFFSILVKVCSECESQGTYEYAGRVLPSLLVDLLVENPLFLVDEVLDEVVENHTRNEYQRGVVKQTIEVRSYHVLL